MQSVTEPRSITFELPADITIGDILTAQGAIFHVSTTFVDWERLHAGRTDAISAPGRLLLRLAHVLDNDVSDRAVAAAERKAARS